MKRLHMVGDPDLIGSRHEFEEEGRLNMSKPLYEVGEEVEVKFIGKITQVLKGDKYNYYKIQDVDSGAFGTFQEKQIQELLEPDDFEPEGLEDFLEEDR